MLPVQGRVRFHAHTVNSALDSSPYSIPHSDRAFQHIRTLAERLNTNITLTDHEQLILLDELPRPLRGTVSGLRDFPPQTVIERIVVVDRPVTG